MEKLSPWVDEQFSQQLIVMLSPAEPSIVLLLIYFPTYIVYHVTKDGWDFIGNEDVGPLIWETKRSEGGFSMIPL